MKKRPDKVFLDEMSRNPNYWKGVFYYNPRDPRLMVPKLIPSMGWTLNFASPWAYVSLGLIILITIASVLFQ
jgi:uncharacterized membrane protein